MRKNTQEERLAKRKINQMKGQQEEIKHRKKGQQREITQEKKG